VHSRDRASDQSDRKMNSGDKRSARCGAITPVTLNGTTFFGAAEGGAKHCRSGTKLKSAKVMNLVSPSIALPLFSINGVYFNVFGKH